MQHEFPCLYCSDDKRLRTDEHVLQRAFGTRLVLKHDVCDSCNRLVFSPLDTELVNYVRTQARAGHPDIEHNKHILDLGQSISMDPITGAWFSVRRSREQQIVPLRQIVIVGDHHAVAVPDPQVLQRLREDLLAPSGISIQTIVTGKDVQAQPAIIWTRPKHYAARASNEDAAQSLLQEIISGRCFGDDWRIDVTSDTFKDRNVKVQLEFEIRHDRINRSIAKTAVNFLCFALGPDFARRPEFAPYAPSHFRKDHTIPIYLLKLIHTEMHQTRSDLLPNHSAGPNITRYFCPSIWEYPS